MQTVSNAGIDPFTDGLEHYKTEGDTEEGKEHTEQLPGRGLWGRVAISFSRIQWEDEGALPTVVMTTTAK